MIIEHVAFVVKDPEAACVWYCEHLGFKELRRGGGGDIFVSDEDGSTILQLEDARLVSDEEDIADHASRDARQLHLAFSVDDVAGTCQELLEAEATMEGEILVTEDGDEMVLLRDPWGLPFQLVKRKERMKRAKTVSANSDLGRRIK